MAAFDVALEKLLSPDLDGPRALRDQAHKLAGSAGMYGFDDLGHFARELVHAIDAGAAANILSGMTQDLKSRLADASASLND